MPSMKEMGFTETENEWFPKTVKKSILENYKENRDFPGIKGTSKLSMHLRF